MDGRHRLLALLIPFLSGCAMCSDCLDQRFAAYGGVRDRTDDRIYGRVASVFDPAAALESSTPPLSDNLQPVPDPAAAKADESQGEGDDDSQKEANTLDDVEKSLKELHDRLPPSLDEDEPPELPDDET